MYDENESGSFTAPLGLHHFSPCWCPGLGLNQSKILPPICSKQSPIFKDSNVLMTWSNFLNVAYNTLYNLVSAYYSSLLIHTLSHSLDPSPFKPSMFPLPSTPASGPLYTLFPLSRMFLPTLSSLCPPNSELFPVNVHSFFCCQFEHHSSGSPDTLD